MCERHVAGLRRVALYDRLRAQGFFEQKLGAALQSANINIQPKFFQVTNIMKA